MGEEQDRRVRWDSASAEKLSCVVPTIYSRIAAMRPRLEFCSKGLPSFIERRTYSICELFAFLSLLRGFPYLDCSDLIIELNHVVGHGFIATINGCLVGEAGSVEAGW